MYAVQMWERACSRRRPYSRPISRRYTQSNCGSWPASDGGLVADQSLAGVHIHSCGNGHLRFRPYGESLLSNATKGTKKSCPSVRPLAKARRSFAPVSIRGHCPPVCFATTYMQRVRLRRTALRATPRVNTSTQPPEGAGGSRSKACRRANARP
jgi:hypothetical protein